MKNENIFLKPHQRFRVLNYDEILKPDDLVRHMYEDNTWNVEGGWDKTYRGSEWRGTAWHKVETELSGWVGKTYHDFLVFFYESANDLSPLHEIIRLDDPMLTY